MVFQKIPFNYKRSAAAKKRKRATRKPGGFKKVPFNYRRSANIAARVVKRELNRRAETKFIPLTSMNQKVPAAIQSGNKCFMLGLIMGTTPSSWTSMENLGGIKVEAADRDGLNVYLKHTTLQLNIDMKHNLSSRTPCEFRVIHAKQRRSALPAGITTNPGVALFMGIDGNPFGHASTTFTPTGTDIMMQPLNKREFIILSDKRFYLQKPSHVDSDGGGQLTTNGYKCTKNMRFTFSYNKNTRYNETSDLPENLAYHHFVYIFARSIDQDSNADNWEINTRGTTTFQDL